MSWKVLDNPRPAKRSTASKFADAFNQGAQMLYADQEAKRTTAQQNAVLKQLTGLDFEGIQDPKLREHAFSMALQAHNQKALQDQKLQGKRDLQQEKQDQIASLFGGNKGQNNPQNAFAEQVMGQGSQVGQQDYQNQMGGQQGGGLDVGGMSPEDILRATMIDPNIGKSLQHSNDVAIRERRAEKEFNQRDRLANQSREDKKAEIRQKAETKISDPVMLELNEARKNIPLQEQAIQDIKMSIPEVGARDYLAEITGFEPLRSAEGAKLKTAIKDFFLSDLSRAGARPNQWIEQQLADALPKIGRDPIANQVVASGMQFKVDLAKKRIDILDELAEADREKHGYVKGDIDARASKLLRPYVEQRKKDLLMEIESVKKSPKTEQKYIRMRSPEGELIDILPQDVEEAEEHGYIHG